MGKTAESKNQDFKAATASDAMNSVHQGKVFHFGKNLWCWISMYIYSL